MGKVHMVKSQNTAYLMNATRSLFLNGCTGKAFDE
jgi:hypothetical protein